MLRNVTVLCARGECQIADILHSIHSLPFMLLKLSDLRLCFMFSSFQSAMGHMGAAVHDILRGTLAIINPAAWQPILPLPPRPLRDRPLLDPRPFLATPLIDRRASQDGRPLPPLPLLRPLRPPVGLLALQRVMELGMNRRQQIFDRYAPLPLNPRSLDAPDSRESRSRKEKKKEEKKE